MLSVLGAAGRGVGLQRAGIQRAAVGAQPPLPKATGVVPRRGHLSTGGRQQLLRSAQAGGSGSNRGRVSGDASSPIPWTQELVDTLLTAVTRLGGPYKATPWAVLEVVKWPGLSETQVAGFLQTLRVQEQALSAAVETMGTEQNGAAGGRRQTLKRPGYGEMGRLDRPAAKAGLRELQGLSQQGSDPSAADSDGASSEDSDCDSNEDSADEDSDEDSDGMTPLHEAAMTGDVECIRLLVQHGADVEARDSYDCTPLHLAAYYGQGAACKELVALGASLGSRDCGGNSLLVAAALADESGEGVRALVQLGASPIERDPRMGATPLHAAALYGTVGADRALLELGADVDAADSRGLRPLHAAAIGPALRAIAVAQLLLQAGADVSATDKEGRTPLHYAAMRGKVPFIQLLLSAGAEKEARDSDGFTPAQLAAQEGQAEARALLDAAGTQGFHQGQCLAGTPTGSVPVNGYESPPQLSMSELSLDVLCTLLQQGLNPDTLVTANCTLLQQAAGQGFLEAIRMLVHYGATLECHGNLPGQTALHVAAIQGQPAACRELVALGANLDARDNEGRTPLMLAANTDESGDCVRVLVQAGADIHCTDANGNVPLGHAVAEGMLGAAKVLLEAGAAGPNSGRAGLAAMNLAAFSQHPNAVPIVRLLLAAGVAESLWREAGITPLHLAAFTGHAQLVKVLLEAGARPDARDMEGKTPAQLAAQKGHAEVERLLQQAA